MKNLRQTALAAAFVPVFFGGGMAQLPAQTPPPPPPPSENDGREMRGISGGFDLSQVPVPTADAKAREPALTAEERQSGVVMLSVVPLGYVPKPIIYIDKSGMPRERYRNPLEYPPSVYHVKTKKGTIRIVAGQNRIGPATPVPKFRQLDFSFEIPPDPDAEPSKGDRGPRLRRIGTIPVGPATTHLLAVVWKEPGKKLWSKPLLRTIDVSPARGRPNEAWTINRSALELLVGDGASPHPVSPGFFGRVPLTANDRGDLRLVVAARVRSGAVKLSDTVLRPREKSDRVFLLAWSEPRSPARPTGVGFISLLMDLPPPEPFPESKHQ